MKKYLVILFILITTQAFAQSKITELTNDASPTGDDLLVTVNDPGGTPATRKATIANVLVDGNIPNTITIDAATALSADPSNCASSGLAGGITANGTAEACITPHAGTNIANDLEEEVTEGSLADSTIVSADIKDGEIVSSDISSDTITHANIVDSDQADTKCIWFEDPTAADDFNSIWANKTSNDFLLTEIWAESDQTVTFMLQVDDGTPADVDSVDLAPAAGEAEDTSLNGDTTVAAGEELDIDLVSVANTPTWVSICWTGNWVD